MKNDGIPLVGAQIYELHSPTDTTLSDSLGFFQLRMHPQTIDHLIVEIDQIKDTIDLVQKFAGESYKILFTHNRLDTFFVKKPSDGSREQ